MKTIMTVAALALAMSVAACTDSENDTDDARQNASMAMDQMPDNMMDTADNPRPASSTGTVTAVDAKAGKVTLDHAAIAEANWPAMTMEFDAEPQLLADLGVGDKVAFDVQIHDGGGKITAIAKR